MYTVGMMYNTHEHVGAVYMYMYLLRLLPQLQHQEVQQGPGNVFVLPGQRQTYVVSVDMEGADVYGLGETLLHCLFASQVTVNLQPHLRADPLC